jgi:hypothetical protein
MLVEVYFFGKGPGQGQIPKQQTYVENFSSLGALAAEK